MSAGQALYFFVFFWMMGHDFHYMANGRWLPWNFDHLQYSQGAGAGAGAGAAAAAAAPCIIIILGFSALHFLPEGKGTSDLLCLFHHHAAGQQSSLPSKGREKQRENYPKKIKNDNYIFVAYRAHDVPNHIFVSRLGTSTSSKIQKKKQNGKCSGSTDGRSLN